MRVALPQASAVVLATLFVQTLADELGIRVLFIKGVAAQSQGLRDSRPSTDVDALVDPASFDRLVAALCERGWMARYDAPDERLLLPKHSVALVHPDWPCDLDLHLFFVGMFAHPGVAFETLWGDHERHGVGGQAVCTPSLNGHRLILILNCLRSPDDVVKRGEAQLFADTLRASPDAWRATLDLARRTRSLTMLQLFAQALELPDPGSDLSAAEARQVSYILLGENNNMSVVHYQFTRSSTPLRQRIRSAASLVFKSERVLKLERTEFDGGIRATWKANLRRWEKGARQLIGMLRKDHSPGASYFGADRLTALTQGTAGQAFVLPQAKPKVPLAELRYVDGEVTLKNAPPGHRHYRPRDPLFDAHRPIELSRFGSAPNGDTQYLMPLGAPALAAEPRATPVVVAVDPAGQEILECLRRRPADLAAIVAEISNRHGLRPVEIQPGVEAFVRHMIEVHILTQPGPANSGLAHASDVFTEHTATDRIGTN